MDKATTLLNIYNFVNKIKCYLTYYLNNCRMFKIRYSLHDNYINNFPLIFTDKIYTYITYCLQSKGPLFIKIGQFLSSKQDFLPRDLINKLTILQDANPCELPNYKSVIVRPERLDLLHLLGSGSIGSVFKCVFTFLSSYLAF